MIVNVHSNPIGPDEVEPEYDRDVMGGVVVRCTGCGAKTYIHNQNPEPQCYGCLKTFVYRPWWEW